MLGVLTTHELDLKGWLPASDRSLPTEARPVLPSDFFTAWAVGITPLSIADQLVFTRNYLTSFPIGSVEKGRALPCTTVA
eukprot:540312-Amphidinium_carterae.1